MEQANQYLVRSNKRKKKLKCVNLPALSPRKERNFATVPLKGNLRNIFIFATVFAPV